MRTGLEAKLDHAAVGQMTPAEAARAEVRRLTERQRLLPNLMREAAAAGRFEAVARLRAEFDQLPVKLWAAEYTEVQSELATWDVTTRGHRDRHDLLERATELAREVHGR